MDITQSKDGALFKDRDIAVASGVATTIIDGVTPPVKAEGLNILFSMDNVAAWATATLSILNHGVEVWRFEDQFLTLLEEFYLFREVNLGDSYSAVLTQTSGAAVIAAIQIGIGPRAPVSL